MTQPLPAFLFWLCGGSGLFLVVIAIPLWLRRVPPNLLYGARFASTLAEPRVWYKINARAGRDLAIAGVAYTFVIAGIARSPGWNNPAGLLVATGAWVAVLISITVRLSKAAARLRVTPRHNRHDERLPNER